MLRFCNIVIDFLQHLLYYYYRKVMRVMKKAIGGRIREIREQCDFTQEFVANQLGISRQKLARIEKGQNDISFDIITRVAEIFGVQTTDITNVSAPQPVEMFRSGGNSLDSFSKIEEIVNMFFANRNLYNRITMEEDDD